MMNELIVRKAILDDSGDIWAWRNDAITRQMSKSTDMIDWATHQAWLKKALADNSTYIFLSQFRRDDCKIGVCRFDIHHSGQFATVSLNLNPDMRGRGYSTRVLSMSIAEFLNLRPMNLSATIRNDNMRSISTFLRCGFSRVSGDEIVGHFQLTVRD